MVITSLNNDKIKELIKLKERKNRKKQKEFLIEGKHLVLEACKKGIVKEIILLENATFTTDIPVIYVSSDVMNKLSDMESPSDIMALCNMEDNDVLGEKLVLLDDIQDPGNLGTIIRSSLAFNINIITRDLKEVIEELKQRKIPIYGTKVDGGMDVKNLSYRDHNKYALVMGNEGNGVSSEILNMCDEYLYIKMNQKVESLNVGVATGIILYELNK